MDGRNELDKVYWECINNFEYDNAIVLSEHWFAADPSPFSLYYLTHAYYRKNLCTTSLFLLNKYHDLAKQFIPLRILKFRMTVLDVSDLNYLFLPNHTFENFMVELKNHNKLYLNTYFYLKPSAILNLIAIFYINKKEYTHAFSILTFSLELEKAFNWEAISLINKLVLKVDIKAIPQIGIMEKTTKIFKDDLNLHFYSDDKENLKHYINPLQAPRKIKPVLRRSKRLDNKIPQFDSMKSFSEQLPLSINILNEKTNNVPILSTITGNNHLPSYRLKTNRTKKLKSTLRFSQENFSDELIDAKLISPHNLSNDNKIELNHKINRALSDVNANENEPIRDSNSDINKDNIMRALNITSIAYHHLSRHQSDKTIQKLLELSNPFTTSKPCGGKVNKLQSPLLNKSPLATNKKCYSPTDKALYASPEKSTSLGSHALIPYVLNMYGKAHFEACEYEKAVDSYEKCLDLRPDYLEGLENYATCLYKLKLTYKLSALASRLSKDHRDNSVTWCVVGIMFSMLSEHNNAIKAIKRALQLDPKMAHAYILAGHEYVSLNNLPLASTAFHTALNHNPTLHLAWYGLGMIALKTERYMFAEHFYNKAIAIFPKRAVFYCHLGIACINLKKTKQALRYFDEAISIDPKFPLAIYYRAQLTFEYENKPMEAISQLASLNKIAPSEPKIYYTVAQIYEKMGNYTESLKNMRWALGLEEKSQAALGDQYSRAIHFQDTRNESRNLIDKIDRNISSIMQISGGTKAKAQTSHRAKQDEDFEKELDTLFANELKLSSKQQINDTERNRSSNLFKSNDNHIPGSEVLHGKLLQRKTVPKSKESISKAKISPHAIKEIMGKKDLPNKKVSIKNPIFTNLLSAFEEASSLKTEKTGSSQMDIEEMEEEDKPTTSTKVISSFKTSRKQLFQLTARDQFKTKPLPSNPNISLLKQHLDFVRKSNN